MIIDYHHFDIIFTLPNISIERQIHFPPSLATYQVVIFSDNFEELESVAVDVVEQDLGAM